MRLSRLVSLGSLLCIVIIDLLVSLACLGSLVDLESKGILVILDLLVFLSEIFSQIVHIVIVSRADVESLICLGLGSAFA